MKLRLAILSILLGSVSALPAVTVTGVRQVGYGGINNVNGDNFWWFCFEPNGSGAPDPDTGNPADNTFEANILSLSSGWISQNTERFNFFTSNPNLITDVVPVQVKVMQYVMDTYLPWDTLAGASGKFTEQMAATSGIDPVDSHPMYDALLAVQHFGTQVYGNVTKTDFTTFGDFTAPDWVGQGFSPAAITARDTIYNNILTDLQGKSGSFFDTYTAEHEYFITNSFFSEGSPQNWQDGIVIGPVPEPSGALLIGAVGLLVTLRRARKRLA